MPLNIIFYTITLISVIGIAIYSVDSVSLLWNPLGLAFVIFGTLAASFLTYPPKTIFSAFKNYVDSFLYEGRKIKALKVNIPIFLEVLTYIQQKKIKQAEDSVYKITTPHIRDVFAMSLDHINPLDETTELLENQHNEKMIQLKSRADLLLGMGNYAPAFGMMGTILGLINLLSEISPDNIKSLTAGLAIALLTTLYGILLANLVFKPMAKRLYNHGHLLNADNEITVLMMRIIHQRKTPAYALDQLSNYFGDIINEIQIRRR